jgi:hypothetical protein
MRITGSYMHPTPAHNLVKVCMQEFLAVEMLAARFSPAANLASPDLLDTRTRIVCIEDMERCGINGPLCSLKNFPLQLPS